MDCVYVTAWNPVPCWKTLISRYIYCILPLSPYNVLSFIGGITIFYPHRWTQLSLYGRTMRKYSNGYRINGKHCTSLLKIRTKPRNERCHLYPSSCIALYHRSHRPLKSFPFSFCINCVYAWCRGWEWFDKLFSHDPLNFMMGWRDIFAQRVHEAPTGQVDVLAHAQTHTHPCRIPDRHVNTCTYCNSVRRL